MTATYWPKLAARYRAQAKRLQRKANPTIHEQWEINLYNSKAQIATMMAKGGK